MSDFVLGQQRCTIICSCKVLDTYSVALSVLTLLWSLEGST